MQKNRYIKRTAITRTITKAVALHRQQAITEAPTQAPPLQRKPSPHHGWQQKYQKIHAVACAKTTSLQDAPALSHCHCICRTADTLFEVLFGKMLRGRYFARASGLLIVFAYATLPCRRTITIFVYIGWFSGCFYSFPRHEPPNVVCHCFF